MNVLFASRMINQEGKIWIADSDTSSILVFNPKTNVTIPYATSSTSYTDYSSPYLLKKDNRRNIWFNERLGNRIAKYDPTTMTMIEIELPFSSTADLPGYVPPPCCKIPTELPMVSLDILSVASCNSVNLWFIESLVNRIGVVYADYAHLLEISVNPEVAELKACSSLTLKT